MAWRGPVALGSQIGPQKHGPGEKYSHRQWRRMPAHGRFLSVLNDLRRMGTSGASGRRGGRQSPRNIRFQVRDVLEPDLKADDGPA